MSYMDISTYIDTIFHPDCAPRKDTVLDQIKRGDMPFRHAKIGGKWFIDPEVIEHDDASEHDQAVNDLINKVNNT